MNPMNMSTPNSRSQRRHISSRKQKISVKLNDSIHGLNLGSPSNRNGTTTPANNPDKSDKQIEKVLKKVNDM